MAKITYKPRHKPMALEDYPEAIAEVRAAIARCDQHIFSLQTDIDHRKARFDHVVAHDKELKNDTQRRATWKEYSNADHQYQGWLALLRNKQEIRTQHEIKLELLRNAFAVAKLQVRQGIAEAFDREGLAV